MHERDNNGSGNHGSSVLENASRGSFARRATENFREGVVDFIHWAGNGKINEHVLTTVSILGVKLGAYIGKKAMEDESLGLRFVAGAVVTLSALIDAIDGKYARKYGNPTLFGKLFDVFGDRTKEAILNVNQAITANENGDPIGEGLALAVLRNSIGPSLGRAEMEAKGLAVPEEGYGIWGRIGTHPGRMVIGTLNTMFGDIRLKEIPGVKKLLPKKTHKVFDATVGNITVQAVLDGILFAANEKTKNGRKNGSGAYDPYEKQKEERLLSGNPMNKEEIEQAEDEKRQMVDEAGKKAMMLSIMEDMVFGMSTVISKELHPEIYA